MNTRRSFIQSAAAILYTTTAASNAFPAAGSRSFFTVGKVKEHWLFLTPDQKPFFSVGLNHVDSSTLRYPENQHIWEEKYENDQIKWIRESVAPHLRDWEFNSVGWVQEVTVKQQAHSPSFTYEEYQALDMPYFHLLPFIESHSWNPWHRNPDIRSVEFEDWCDYVARDACSRFKTDPKLIGYFYSDCPTLTWTRPHNRWRGPLFNPDLIATSAGRKELYDLARRYYQVTHDAIRRYDPNHLIMGDRYEANAPLPIEIVDASKGLVDVLSFQDFKDPVAHLGEWHRKTGRPVLWADGAWGRDVVDNTGKYREDSYRTNDGAKYAEVLKGLQEVPGAVGAHLCGAFLRNRFRRRGLLDEQERPDTKNIDLIRAANRDMNRWVESFS